MSTLATPRLQFFADLSVQVDQPQEVGKVFGAQRRVIPILGGEVVGDGWRGRILPGGADFQLIASATVAQLDARYVVETDAGDRIFVMNRALRSAPAEVTAKLIRGEPVDPALVYFRCVPTFETGSPALAWIMERIFVGTGVRRPDKVEISVFAVE
ncbi:DUF3237 domain-containing protein [Ramlibacter sp. XY19]|uniref:DUF3237 domain-containing protein n=1 Tax=Ramlibacter paludis TaxID=2908000 RepID=UPI0023D9AE9D|nr:DUF3237 domain-containing protein [Ramlibacter paludis]MCG2591530.1 DUF3237 domain-containing protein [Ramlibacter paludis]